MPNRIAALDLGTHAIKLVELEVGRDIQVVTFDRERLPTSQPGYVSGESTGTSEDPSGTTDVDSDSPTGPETDQTDDQASTESAETDSVGDNSTSPTDDGADSIDTLDAPWQQALSALLQRHEFSEDTVFVTFLPEGRAISIHEDVPLSDRNKVAGILPHRLEDRLPQEPEDLLFDFNLLEDKDEGDNTALVGLALKRHIGQFLEDIGSRGVDPAVIGIPEIMLRYVLEGARSDANSTAAVIDIGHRFTRVIVLEEDRAVMARSIKMAGNRITRAIARNYEVTHEQAENYKHERGRIVPGTSPSTDPDVRAFSDTITDALKPLVRDLRNSFQSLYARDNVRLDEIFVTGGTSRLRGLDDHLASEFQVPVDVLPVSEMIDAHRIDQADRPLATMGLSLGLQQIYDSNGDHLLDLRQGEFAYRGSMAELRNRVLKVAALAVGVLVLVAGLMYSHQYMLESRASAMRSAVASQTEEVFGTPAYSASEIRQRVQTGQGDSGRTFIPQMSAFEVMYQIFDHISEETQLQINSLDVDTDRNIIQMDARTSSPSAVDRIVSDLQAIDCFTNIDTAEVRVRNEDTAEFQLEIASECSG